MDLEEFGIDCKDIKRAKKLTETIPKDSKLDELVEDCKIGTTIASSGKCKSLLKLVVEELSCNASSFDPLCQSNHQLNKIRCHISQHSYALDGILREAFEINAQTEYSVKRRLCCKLRRLYFRKGCNVEPFTKLEVKLIHYLIFLSW